MAVQPSIRSPWPPRQAIEPRPRARTASASTAATARKLATVAQLPTERSRPAFGQATDEVHCAGLFRGVVNRLSIIGGMQRAEGDVVISRELELSEVLKDSRDPPMPGGRFQLV